MRINRHTELEVFKKSFAAAMEIFRESRAFPKEERYSLIDQIRRSSRSVSANITEAWRKRRYPASWTIPPQQKIPLSPTHSITPSLTRSS
jgi:hypothetical protein